jgi:tetratricopeptide (TPR) repeat protein
MQDQGVIGFISNNFNSEECSLILGSLRQDAIIWASIDEPSFGQKAVQKFGNQFSYWNPADIAALFAGIDISTEELAAAPLIQLNAGLRSKALSAFEVILKSRREPSDPAESLLIALALRERRRLTHSWNGIPDELARTAGSGTADFITWRSPFAILYKLIPDPADLLEKLVSFTTSNLGHRLMTHIILANPQTVDEQFALLQPVFAKKPVENLLFWLKELSDRGKDDLAARLATDILDSTPELSAVELGFPTGPGDALKQLANIRQLKNLSALNALSKNPDDALANISMAQEFAQKLFSSITLEKVRLAAKNNQNQLAALAARQVLPFIPGGEQKKLKVSKNLGKIFGLINSESHAGDEDPVQILREAELLLQSGDLEKARTLAGNAILEIEKYVTEDNQDEFTRGEDISFKALEQMIALQFFDESEKIISHLLKQRPSDPDLAGLTGMLQKARGDSSSAWKSYKLASALRPEDPRWFFENAELLHSCEQYEAEMDERRKVLALSPEIRIDDQLALGKAAYRCGKTLETIQICEDILALDPENGPAHTLLGNCYQEIGDLDKAQFILTKATQLSSKDPVPWLSLSKVYETRGEEESASATLRSALLAVSDSAELNYEMSQQYLRKNLLSEAVPYLRKAASISPKSADTAIELGKTLKSLGHLNEVFRVYEQASKRWPGDPKLAVEFGNLLAEEKKYTQALPFLESAVNAENRDVPLVLNYARSLFGGDLDEILLNNLYQDEAKVEKVFGLLKDMPQGFTDNPLLQFVLGIIHIFKRENEKAFEVFRSLVEKMDADKGDLRWLFQTGLGIAAIQMGMKEVGITSLKEAVQAKPNNFKLLQKLAEIYLSANLIQDAYAAAQQALNLQPHSVENVLWYAKTMDRIGQDNEAEEALRSAALLNPEEPALQIQMAKLAIKLGKHEQAGIAADAALKSEELTEELLKDCASVFETIGKNDLALECLKRAVDKSEHPQADFLFQTAKLCKQAGDLETALNLTQRMINESPALMDGYILQAAILAGYDRPAAALETLESALLTAENFEEQSAPAEKKNAKSAEIHRAYADVLARMGNFPSALLHAEKAVDLNPGRLEYRAAAAALASQLLLPERIDKFTDLASIKVKDAQEEDGNGIGQDAMASLFSLKIEKEMDDGNFEAACGHLESAASLFPSHPALIKAKIRLLKGQHNDQEVKELLDEYPELVDIETSAGSGYETSGDVIRQIQDTISRASILLGFEKWKEALNILKDLGQKYPSNPKVLLSQASAMVLCAEEEQRCAEMGISARYPGLVLTEAGNFEQLKKALLTAKKLSKSTEIDRWAKRAELAFMEHPDVNLALTLQGGKPGDEAAMIAALRRAGESEKALSLANELQQSEEINYELALCGLDADPQQGLLYLQKSFPAEGVNPRVYGAMYLLQKETGDVSGSMRAIEEALQHFPDEAIWHLWAGETLNMLNREEEAILHLEKACVLKPEDHEFKMELADQLVKNRQIRRAVSLLEEISAENPADGAVRLKLADCYRQNGEYEVALEKVDEAAALMPESVDPLLVKGKIHSHLGRLDDAEICAKEALEKSPASVKALLFMSNILRNGNRLRENLALLEEAVQKTAGNKSVLLERARLVDAMEGAVEALPLFQKLADLNPDDADILAELARAQSATGDNQSAEKTALISLGLNPRQACMHSLVGKLQLDAGQLDQAIQHFSEAIRLAPDDLATYLNLGQAYQNRRENSMALKTYRQAIDNGIKDVRAFVQAGILMRDGKDFQGAETMFRRAAEMMPDDLSIKKQLAAVVTLNLVHNSQEANSAI